MLRSVCLLLAMSMISSVIAQDNDVIDEVLNIDMDCRPKDSCSNQSKVFPKKKKF